MKIKNLIVDAAELTLTPSIFIAKKIGNLTNVKVDTPFDALRDEKDNEENYD